MQNQSLKMIEIFGSYLHPSICSQQALFGPLSSYYCGQDPSCSASGVEPCQWMSVTQHISVMKEEKSNKLSTATVLESPRKYQLPETKCCHTAEGPCVCNNSSSKIYRHGKPDKLINFLKANVLTLQVKVKRILLLLCIHSEVLSSRHTYYPQSSCS